MAILHKYTDAMKAITSFCIHTVHSIVGIMKTWIFDLNGLIFRKGRRSYRRRSSKGKGKDKKMNLSNAFGKSFYPFLNDRLCNFLSWKWNLGHKTKPSTQFHENASSCCKTALLECYCEGIIFDNQVRRNFWDFSVDISKLWQILFLDNFKAIFEIFDVFSIRKCF